MSINEWGPRTWRFFHNLADKIIDHPVVVAQTFQLISNICSFLPCPDCTAHASIVIGRVNPTKLKTKSELIDFVWVFHNIVNKRKNKPFFPKEQLVQYATDNIVLIFNDFVSHFHTHGNMTQLTESFHRARLLKGLKKWMLRELGRTVAVVAPKLVDESPQILNEDEKK